MPSPKLKLNLYQKLLGLDHAQFSLIQHEDAIVAIVYEVIEPSGKKLILKICEQERHFLREVYFLEALKDKIPVPQILQAIEPNSKRHGAILMEYLPGQVLNKETLTCELAEKAGYQLARLHLNSEKGYGDLISKDSLTQDPKADLIQRFEEGLDECEAHLPSSLLNECRHYFHTHLYLLELADGPCIIHRDFRPGNLLANKNKLLGIIDWASARAGFAQEDFSSLEMGEWSTQASIQAAFLSGYETIRPIPRYQELMPLLKLSRSAAILGYLYRKGIYHKSSAKLHQSHLNFLKTFIEA
ncbi:phosphotransferase enzyme family protein [Simkania negevensis]|uniref:Protein kinase domain-containing protein n=1 Tax=Simkania negevensis (strain ATCC VR-1471 / DSM 27360 / Z) TaxID=331113 RepID=F8L749_SIMNZ|nr:phosphotransferase [Simkania negevensis]CCB88564.1 putative uncharacterized protein [Simkania negevensis Z]